MSFDPEIQRTIDIGAKNQATLSLLRNWCAHVRIEKFGGTGIVEQITGYPIGNHFVACDFSDNSGSATWDLADSALAFHDRNCVACPNRKPVGFPNLSQLVGERDAAAEVERQRAEASDQAERSAREARLAERRMLRAQLGDTSPTVIDQLEVLDGSSTPDAIAALRGTAKLAPEAFPEFVVEHLFRLVERNELWAAEAALGALLELGANPVRLARAAMLTLRRPVAPNSAAEIVIAKSHHVDPADVEGAVRRLAELALPLRDIFETERTPRPEALRALHKHHPRAVESALENLIAAPDDWGASTGARGAVALGDEDSGAALRLSRAVISKLARSPDLSDYRENGRELLYPLLTAAANAYRHDPAKTDALMQQFLVGASDQGKRRVFRIYREILGGRRLKVDCTPGSATDVALRRLIAATTEKLPDEVRQEIQSVFQSEPHELKPLAARQVDGLLGAAVLLDDRLQMLDEEMEAPVENMLEALARGNRRSTDFYLQGHLVKWAAAAAAGDLESTKQYIALLEGLPDNRDRIRGAMVKALDELAVSPETFGLVLPTLYGALIGPSVALRGRAARTLSELDRRRLDDAPPMLFEALLALFNDPYIFVLNSVVAALKRFRLPEVYDDEVTGYLCRLATALAKQGGQSELVVDCLDLLIRRYFTKEQLSGRIGEQIIDILERQAPDNFAGELDGWVSRFHELPSFGRLVLKAVRDESATNSYCDDIARALRDLPPRTIRAHRESLISAAVDLAASPLGPVFVEMFAAAKDWDGAEQAANAALALQPDTRHGRYRRLTSKILVAAVAHERAIDEGQMADLPHLAAEWRAAVAERDQAPGT